MYLVRALLRSLRSGSVLVLDRLGVNCLLRSFEHLLPLKQGFSATVIVTLFDLGKGFIMPRILFHSLLPNDARLFLSRRLNNFARLCSFTIRLLSFVRLGIKGLKGSLRRFRFFLGLPAKTCLICFGWQTLNTQLRSISLMSFLLTLSL